MERSGEIGCRMPALGQITYDDGDDDNDDDDDDGVHLSINALVCAPFQVTVYFPMFLVCLCMGTHMLIAYD